MAILRGTARPYGAALWSNFYCPCNCWRRLVHRVDDHAAMGALAPRSDSPCRFILAVMWVLCDCNSNSEHAPRSKILETLQSHLIENARIIWSAAFSRSELGRGAR